MARIRDGLVLHSRTWRYSHAGWTCTSALPAIVSGERRARPRYAGIAGGGALGQMDNVEFSVVPGAGTGLLTPFEVSIRNTADVAVFVDRLEFLRAAKSSSPSGPDGVGAESLRMLTYNDSANLLPGLFQTGNRPFAREPERDSDVTGDMSRLMTALYLPGTESGVFFGAVPAGERLFYSAFQLSRTHLSGDWEVGIHLAPGETVAVGKVMLYAGDELDRALAEFAGMFGTPRPAPELVKNAGWNSWDYYLWQVSAEAVRENMQYIADTPWLRERIKYIVLDDGWQHAWGEWYANHRFPGGMKKMADEIAAAGFVPGIWVGPFLETSQGQTATSKPELLIRRRETGLPVTMSGGSPRSLCLDPTHPGTHELLRKVFGRLREAGYRYFKTDFLWYAISAVRSHGGAYHDPEVPPMEALRNAMQTVREAIGEDSILVGCGGFIPEIGVGIYDSCRTSQDISSYWSNVLAIARDLSVKSVFSGKAWENDYDFLVVRGRETAKERRINVYKDLNVFVPTKPYKPFTLRSGPTIQTVNEARVWASLVLISGGSLVLADRLSMLNEAGLQLVRTVCEYATGAVGRPLDLFCEGVPSVWLAETPSTRLLALFNWGDVPTVVDPLPFLERADVNARSAYEIWTQTEMPLSPVEIEGRDCRIFQLLL